MMTTPVEVSLGNADVELVVLPGLGARLHRLRVRGFDLLRTPANPGVHAQDPFFWGAFVMAPWCNRVAPGPLAIGESEVNLAPNFRDGSAIHGQVYAAPWTQTGAGSFAIEREGAGWPWHYRVEMTVAVEGWSILIAQRLVNLAARPMPGGIGLHPWFVGNPQVAINSAAVYAPNAASPAQPEPVSGDLDLRQRSHMAADVDATWTSVAPPQAELWWPEHGLHARLTAAGDTPHIVAANPLAIDAIAVEPETHAPQGLRRLLKGEPGAMALLDPGAVLELLIEFELDEQ